MNQLNQHLNGLPSDLVVVLQTEFQKLHEQYFLGRWEPTQLDGGRFAEAVLRVVEHKGAGTHTPIGKQLNREQIVHAAENNTALPDSLRFQVPKLAALILDFRNKRNVGHLGPIDVNELDAVLVMNVANWILAELVRLETNLPPADAQAEIKRIIERKVPIVEEIGGRLKCLDPDLKATEKSLVFLYQRHPHSLSLDTLVDWIEYSNKGVLRGYLEKAAAEGLIDFRNDTATLTRKGVLWVEKNISFEIVL